MDIHWYPGHMTKTRRMIESNLKQVDLLCELLDARIPRSSRNPDIDRIAGNKPRLMVLNRADLADPAMSRCWLDYYRSQGSAGILIDAKKGTGVSQFSAAVREALQEKLARRAERGQAGRMIRVMIVGIPNVGKSTFINKLAGRKTAKAEDRPGVTRGKQWITVDSGLCLLDTPGILWPKFEDPDVARNLAFTKAVKDEVVDAEELACLLMERLWRDYPDALRARYQIEPPEDSEDPIGFSLLTLAGKRRGFLMSGGVVNTERMAAVLLEEFRSGKLGRFTLETPDEIRGEKQNDVD